MTVGFTVSVETPCRRSSSFKQRDFPVLSDISYPFLLISPLSLPFGDIISRSLVLKSSKNLLVLHGDLQQLSLSCLFIETLLIKLMIKRENLPIKIGIRSILHNLSHLFKQYLILSFNLIVPVLQLLLFLGLLPQMFEFGGCS